MTRPNIVFIFSDQQHWRAAGFADPSFTTPALDALAAEATVFDYAFCTTPQCSPSRSSIVTGLYPDRTGVLGNVGAAGGDPLRTRTIAPRLREAGYRTAYFGKWHLGKDPLGTAGWDEDFGVKGAETTDDAEVTRRAERFLEDRADPHARYKTRTLAGFHGQEHPFALFLSYNNPHDIYHFGRGDRAEGEAALHEHHGRDALDAKPAAQRQFMDDDQGAVMAGATDADWRAYRALYREKVRLYDEHVGRVLRALRRLGLWDETIIVVTSDHGDMDATHGLVYKGPFMYEQMMRVPLVVRVPEALGGRGPRRVDPLVVNVDLAPTLLELAGAEPAEPCDGMSLRPLLTGQDSGPGREFVIGQYYSKQRWVNPIRMIRTDRWKLTRYSTGEGELYDLAADPGELENLIDRPGAADVAADLGARLNAWMAARADPFPAQRATRRDGAPLV